MNVRFRVLLLAAWSLSLATATIADEAAAIRRFEAAKRTEPELIAFLKEMPKGADLHNHVTGAIYSDFMVDNAVRQGLFFDPSNNRFYRDAAEGRVPAAQLLSNAALLNQFLNKVSQRGWFESASTGHDHFFDTFSVIDTTGLTTEDLLREVIGRARAQKIHYLELMTRCIPDDTLRAVTNNPPAVEDLEAAFAALQPKLEALAASMRPYMDKRDLELAKVSGKGTANPIEVRYIYSFSRLGSLTNFFANAAAGMAAIRADYRVVGMNIVAPEDHPNARNNFLAQMRMLDFLWNKMGRPNLTLHAGELTLPISPVEPLFSRIRDTITIGRAKRIGHGTSIAWEQDLPGLLKLMREQEIMVEICPTSSAVILGLAGDRHPIHLYRRNKIPVTINTDDEGVARSNLTMELLRAVTDYKFGYRDLKEVARNSLEYSFLEGEGLFVKRDYSKIRPEFAGVRSESWKPDERAEAMMDMSPKLRVQVRLERSFIEFER